MLSQVAFWDKAGGKFAAFTALQCIECNHLNHSDDPHHCFRRSIQFCVCYILGARKASRLAQNVRNSRKTFFCVTLSLEEDISFNFTCHNYPGSSHGHTGIVPAFLSEHHHLNFLLN